MSPFHGRRRTVVSLDTLVDRTVRRWRAQTKADPRNFSLIALKVAENAGYPAHERGEVARQICKAASLRRVAQQKRKAKGKKPKPKKMSSREQELIIEARSREIREQQDFWLGVQANYDLLPADPETATEAMD